MNTPEINEQNIQAVRTMIKKKTSQAPYYATNHSVVPVINDMDHHPYSRWFRGVYYYPDPIVAEREAGWRPQHNDCYESKKIVIPEQPRNCFESACSTIFPCYPKPGDADTRHFDDVCIVQYY